MHVLLYIQGARFNQSVNIKHLSNHSEFRKSTLKYYICIYMAYIISFFQISIYPMCIMIYMSIYETNLFTNIDYTCAPLKTLTQFAYFTISRSLNERAIVAGERESS